MATIDRKGSPHRRSGRLFAAHLRPGDITDVAEADLVIEAVVENLGVKSDLFRELAAVAPSETIFASNTSSLSITALGHS